MSARVQFAAFLIVAAVLFAPVVWMIAADPIFGFTFSTAPLSLHVSALPSTVLALVAACVMLAIVLDTVLRTVRGLAYQRGHR